MAEFVVPPYQIDPASLPPPLLNSEPGSFAHHTMTVRVPRIAQDTIEQNSFPPEIEAALRELKDEITGGTTRPLPEVTPERAFWNTASAPYLGRSWLDVPWYWSEAYFYRRILEATGYFQAGPWQGRDPFAGTKATEWRPDGAARAAAALLRALPERPETGLAALLQASLWGNRVDLSYRHVQAQFTSAEGGAAHEAGDASNLLVDQTDLVWQLLSRAPRPGRVTLVADNAGTEQAMDLALIDFLLTTGLAADVRLHLKRQPFFVSDAMPADLEVALGALTQSEQPAAALAGRLRAYMAEGRLTIQTHWAYTTGLHYFQMPGDLRAEWAGSALVIFKGDANYRRLLGDAHWPPEASFGEATAYLPMPLVALRTLKSEVIAGLPEGLAETLEQDDPQWRVNGKRGVIQAKI